MRSALPRRGWRQRGFTMIELLIVVAILAMISIISMFAIMKYFQQSRDAIRKTHIEKFRIALEEYFADYQRYPPVEVFLDCDGPALAPYLTKMPCDPVTNEPYHYVTDVRRQKYSLYARLVVESDPIIADRGCDTGCGPDLNNDGRGDFNYGVSSEQAAVGQKDNTQVMPTCGSGTNKFCSPGSCGNCCPGESYRCNAEGTGCYADSRCPGN